MSNTQPRILIVDDEPVNLYFLEELLQSEGYATLSATSGKEAIALAKESIPNIILLDVMMPDMDGFEVCRRLREDKELITIPIIFLTALDDDESRLKGLEMMGDDYLTKPIKSNLLLAKIASTLRLQQVREQRLQSQLSQQVKEQTRRNLSTAWRINQALTEKFRLFVPEQFLQRIAPEGVESIQLGNVKEEEVSILFCDIRGFTTIAESQQAADTFRWLNAFFTQMNQAIASQGGFIDKFLGDALVAVFDRQRLHPQDALTAAVMMRQSLRDFNNNRALFKLSEPVNIGIGIHAGKVAIGTLGTDSRMDSTVIGDVVNTASRLEEMTKVYGCQVIASSSVLAQAPEPERFCCRCIDRVIPRGKQEAIEIYEVLGTNDCILDEEKWRALPIFNEGMQAWQRGDFSTALLYFQELVKQNPTDQVAALYVDRCQERLAAGDEIAVG
ncbi:MAG: response regulator [Oscillatoriaceae bacterium SKW80]|nr:response regulator [Oscillatoriaceae bacterium SKYG93]MCX8122217.1 response regulator [Oscillatoriaceae bacterium SKW80]MDW8454503.1 response regulator [Oscillatoriaceae cyanobacterium SKYGB_i_bin93]HIK29364.1 response regulator [Oscillatoriaceae cyanobacterium M7585_C2015_266]